MEELRFALIQSELHWEDKSANLEMFASKIAATADKADITVLPEMFSTGFSMQASKFAEEMEGPTITWIAEQAKSADSVITGSLIVQENSKYYNRLIWMRPDGSYEYYDKRHLFRLANEQETYTAGVERKIVSYHDWKINLNVCYDLRFPVWTRNRQDYDILLNVANWPAKRSTPWKMLIRARAIENMCYAVGLNRVGLDGNDYYHSGDSVVIHPNGEALTECSDKEEILYCTLSKTVLESFKSKFQFYKDADDFSITNL